MKYYWFTIFSTRFVVPNLNASNKSGSETDLMSLLAPKVMELKFRPNFESRPDTCDAKFTCDAKSTSRPNFFFPYMFVSIPIIISVEQCLSPVSDNLLDGMVVITSFNASVVFSDFVCSVVVLVNNAEVCSNVDSRIGIIVSKGVFSVVTW